MVLILVGNNCLS